MLPKFLSSFVRPSISLQKLGFSPLRTTSPLLGSSLTDVTCLPTQKIMNTTVRNHWVEQVKDGEDPEKTLYRMEWSIQSEGRDSRKNRYKYYEKPTWKRVRLAEKKVYLKNKAKVERLKKWIVFRHQNKLGIPKKKDLEFK